MPEVKPAYIGDGISVHFDPEDNLVLHAENLRGDPPLDSIRISIHPTILRRLLMYVESPE